MRFFDPFTKFWVREIIRDGGKRSRSFKALSSLIAFNGSKLAMSLSSFRLVKTKFQYVGDEITNWAPNPTKEITYEAVILWESSTSSSK